MNRMKEIRQLQKIIKQSHRRIALIEHQCKHLRVRHKIFPDSYCGQGRSSICLDCGKGLGCSTGPPDDIAEKLWIERKRE